jgi:hypothetical protein
MKVNFAKIIIKDIEGREVEADFQKQLGNQLYMQGRNIEECELGKKIYFTPKDAQTELTIEEIAIVRRAIAGYGYVARQSIIKAMESGQEGE